LEAADGLQMTLEKSEPSAEPRPDKKLEGVSNSIKSNGGSHRKKEEHHKHKKSLSGEDGVEATQQVSIKQTHIKNEKENKERQGKMLSSVPGSVNSNSTSTISIANKENDSLSSVKDIPSTKESMRHKKFPPLFQACIDGRASRIEEMLRDEKNDVNMRGPHGRTALHIAAKYGQVECVKNLLEHRANCAARDDHGKIPLHFAASKGAYRIVELLIAVNEELIAVQDKKGDTPLHLAAEYNKASVINSLLGVRPLITSEHGLAQNEKESTIHKVDRNYIQYVNMRNLCGETVIHKAAVYKDGVCMEVLLALETPSSMSEKERGETATIEARRANQEENNIKDFEEKNKNKQREVERILLDEPNNDLMTALHIAASNGSIRCAQLLLDRGCSVNVADRKGNTPLHLAAMSGCEALVSLLIRKGAKVVVNNKDHKTPMHLATEHEFDDICYILTANGADVSIRYQWRSNSAKRRLQRHETELIEVIQRADRYGYLESPLVASYQKSNSLTSSDYGIGSTNGNSNANHEINKSEHSATLNSIHNTTTTSSSISSSSNNNNNSSKVSYSIDSQSKESKGRSNSSNRRNDTSSSDIKENEQNSKSLSDSTSMDSSQRLKLNSFMEDPKKIEIERKRAVKWAPMIRDWEDWKKNKMKKIKRRIVKGLPDCLRSETWKRLSSCMMAQDRNQANLYQNLLKQDSSYVEQIDLDINRSARNHLQFRERFGSGQIALFNVLKGYSIYDKDVGYCQGMSDMTAFILMYLLEEDAFWMLVQLLNDKKYNLRARFLPGFPLLQQTFWIWEKLLAKYVPKIAKHLSAIGISTIFYATKWFLLVFLDAFPFPILVRIWDLFLLIGYDVVYTVGIRMMKKFQKRILSLEMDQVMAYFKTWESLVVDPDVLIAYLMKRRIKSKEIRALEKQYNKELKNDLPST